MGKTSWLFAIFLLTLSTAASAASKYPPGPGYRSCSDSLRIFELQEVDTLVAPCHPSILDTVLGIGGIVTAFDAKPSAFAVFFQNSQGGPWTGIQAFTGAVNYNGSAFNLMQGDSIVVYGTTQEFPSVGGVTEIEGPDAIQSTNDIVIRKVSSGNPLPRFRILTTHDINWVPGTETPAPRQEQWEECLVRVRGPLHVARTTGSPPLPTNSFLIVNNASPAESVLVDGNSLTTVTPPAVGTLVDSVQGIVIQNTTSGVNSYRVALRSSSDQFVVTAPNLVDAYPISDALPAARSARLLVSNETLRLVFDRSVDVTSAQNKANYHLNSELDGSTVDAAAVEGGSGAVVLLSVTNVHIRGDQDGVTAGGVGSANCPNCSMSQQSRSFINGVLSPRDVQAPDADSLAGSPCVDRSRFAGPGTTAGTRLAVRGVGTGIFGTTDYLEDAAGGRRSGVAVFGPSAPLTRGHNFLIAGAVQEFSGETEIVNSVFLQDQGTAVEPAPISFTSQQVHVLTGAGCDANQSVDNGEDYEGVLLRVDSVMVVERRTTGQSFFVGRPGAAVAGDTVLVSNLNGALNTFTPPDSGTIIDVVGVLHFGSGTFRICPRSSSDIHLRSSGVAGEPVRAVALRTWPNPARIARLEFTLPRPESVELTVHDLLGRRIAVLARGRFEAGTHLCEWNGCDDTSHQARAGIYWYRLVAGGEVLKVRGALLR